MKIQYFQDTDTLYLELNQNPIIETKEINENTLIDLDKDANICAITVEHSLLFLQQLAKAYQDQSQDEEFQAEIADWDTVVSDGCLNA